MPDQTVPLGLTFVKKYFCISKFVFTMCTQRVNSKRYHSLVHGEYLKLFMGSMGPFEFT